MKTTKQRASPHTKPHRDHPIMTHKKTGRVTKRGPSLPTTIQEHVTTKSHLEMDIPLGDGCLMCGELRTAGTAQLKLCIGAYILSVSAHLCWNCWEPQRGAAEVRAGRNFIAEAAEAMTKVMNVSNALAAHAVMLGARAAKRKAAIDLKLLPSLPTGSTA